MQKEYRILQNTTDSFEISMYVNIDDAAPPTHCKPGLDFCIIYLVTQLCKQENCKGDESHHGVLNIPRYQYVIAYILCSRA